MPNQPRFIVKFWYVEIVEGVKRLRGKTHAYPANTSIEAEQKAKAEYVGAKILRTMPEKKKF